MRGCSSAIVRSDSSPSTTNHPSPVPSFPPSDGTSAISTSIPWSCSRYGVCTRSQPRTSAPHARASSAYALMPAPPIPAIQNLRPSRGEGNELLGDLIRGIGPGKPRHRGGHLCKTVRIVEQRADQIRRAPDLRLRHDHRTAALLEVARVLLLMVAGGEETGHEHRRLARGGQLPDRAARPSQREVARSQRSSELFGECEEAVIRPRYSRTELVVVARARHVQHRGPRLAERVDREIIQHTRTERAAEDEQHRSGFRKAEQPARFLTRDGPRARRNRPTRHAVLRSSTAGDREREEDAPRKR